MRLAVPGWKLWSYEGIVRKESVIQGRNTEKGDLAISILVSKRCNACKYKMKRQELKARRAPILETMLELRNMRDARFYARSTIETVSELNVRDIIGSQRGF